MIRSDLSKILSQALKKSYPENPPVAFSMDEPGTGIHADAASNVALLLAQTLKRPPFEIARHISQNLPCGESSAIKTVETSKNGFLNFILEDHYLRKLLSLVLKDGMNLGSQKGVSQGKVLLEFVSANPTGPLHIGHGRGAALGDSLARIYRQCRYAVETEFYVNDVGVQMQILANSVESRLKEIQGNQTEAFPENGYKGEYIRAIAQAMINQKRDDFQKFPRQFILDWIRKDLEDFGVPFDHWFSEETLHQTGQVEGALRALRAKGVLKEKDGALWFVAAGEDNAEPDKDRVLKKSDGRTTYFASDVAYHKEKFDRGFQTLIDIWGHDHHGYVARVEASIQALGYPKESLKILLYQLVSLKRGGRKVVMSTRAGEFITLKEVVDEVGRDAARFFFAMRSPQSQLEFDVDLAKKQSNENPVFYVQYVHARICSIFREAEKRGIAVDAIDLLKLKRPLEKDEREIAKKMGFFEDILEGCLQISSPHLIAVYLIDLAAKFHKFYDACRVLDAEPEIRAERLQILRAVQTVAKLGLSLIGVSAPEKM